MKIKNEDHLLSPLSAAEYLNTTPRTLAKWRCVGSPKIPYIKIGRLVRYRKSALDDYLKLHTINSEVA